MIVTKSKLYTQILFANKTQKGDWHRAVVYDSYKGDLDKVPFYYFIHNTPHSAVTDLTQDMEVLESKISKHVRQEIRKAIKEGYEFSYGYDYEEFVPYYNAFAEKKGIDIRVSEDRLIGFGNPQPIVTKVSHNGVVLAMHVRAFDKEQKLVMGLYTASGRFFDGVNPREASIANKYLQYREFALFKEMGYETLDWSGINIDPSNKAQYSIGEYKLSFGADVIPSPVLYSPLYKLMLLFRKPYTYIRNKISKNP